MKTEGSHRLAAFQSNWRQEMARTNKQALIKLCGEINKKEGEGSVYSIGSKHADFKISRVVVLRKSLKLYQTIIIRIA